MISREACGDMDGRERVARIPRRPAPETVPISTFRDAAWLQAPLSSQPDRLFHRLQRLQKFWKPITKERQSSEPVEIDSVALRLGGRLRHEESQSPSGKSPAEDRRRIFVAHEAPNAVDAGGTGEDRQRSGWRKAPPSRPGGLFGRALRNAASSDRSSASSRAGSRRSPQPDRAHLGVTEAHEFDVTNDSGRRDRLGVHGGGWP